MTINEIMIFFSGAVEHLANEQIACLLTNTVLYAQGEDVHFDDPVTEAYFAAIKANMDIELKQRKSISQARREAGARGGKTTQANKQNCNLLETKEREESAPSSPVPPVTTQEEKETSTTPKETISNDMGKKVPLASKIKARAEEFGMRLQPYTGNGEGQYPRPMVNEFFKYWTEHGPRDRLMRFEKETSFDVERRLERWSKKEHNKNGSKDTIRHFSKDEDGYQPDYSYSTL